VKLPGLRYANPNTFHGKQRAQLALFPPLIAMTMRILLKSCRWEIRHPEYLDERMAGGAKSVLVTWHEVLPLALYHHRKRNIHTLTSFSFDGELAARVVTRFGSEALRGSSSRGGSGALLQLEKALGQLPCVGLTIDGPRGPRRVAKPGAIIISARTGACIVPNAYAAIRGYRLHSWDRLLLPYPFTQIVCAYAPPLEPPRDSSPEEIERKRLELEGVLNVLHQSLEEELISPAHR